MDYLIQLFAVFLALAFFTYARSLVTWQRRSRGLPLPPGPKQLPIVGNLFNFPTFKPWIANLKLCAEYGDIVHFRVLGRSIVVLGSPSAISEVLEKRSGSDLNFGLLPYGPAWKRYRRTFWRFFNPDAVSAHNAVQRETAHRFLQKLLDDPSRLKELIRYTFGAAVLKIAYGITAEENDQYLAAVDASLEASSQGLVPGKFLVEYLPFLRYIPPWFPGATSQRLWAKWQAAGEHLKNLPLSFTQQVMATSDAARDSVVGQLLSEMTVPNPDQAELVKKVGAVAFQAGADTSFSTLQTVFLAISLHPEVLKKAHHELDAVVGPNRLPEHSDRPSLPYISAIILEALRWHVTVPMGGPHCSDADEEIRGYFIPAGTLLLPTTWAIMHDPEVFPEPHVFRPERFIRGGKLDVGERDPAAFVFGFGRRACPGRYFALDALFINVASVLHVFNITPPVDEKGHIIRVEHRETDGLMSYPEDCRCAITPRSPAAAALIREHAAAAPVASA